MKNNEHDDDEFLFEFKYKIKSMEKDILEIRKTCCSKENLVDKLKTEQLLESLTVEIRSLKKDSDDVITLLNTYKKYLNMLMGALIVFQFFGLGDKIKDIITGG